MSTSLCGNKTYTYDSLFLEDEEKKEARPVLQPGIWHVQVVVESYNNATKAVTEDLLLVKEFLVLPSYEQLSSIKASAAGRLFRSSVNKFWSLESICLHQSDANLQNKAVRAMATCERDSAWSSFFPDPKSTIDSGLINQNRLRAYTEYQSKLVKDL